jgi:hypothetical protein
MTNKNSASLVKKRSSRPSPKVSATGTVKTGNDGNKYIVTKTVAGVKRWKLHLNRSKKPESITTEHTKRSGSGKKSKRSGKKSKRSGRKSKRSGKRSGKKSKRSGKKSKRSGKKSKRSGKKSKRSGKKSKRSGKKSKRSGRKSKRSRSLYNMKGKGILSFISDLKKDNIEYNKKKKRI